MLEAITHDLFVITECAKNKGVQKRMENNEVGKIYKRAFLISPSIGVVTLFIMGHSLRIFLNFFEAHYEEDIMPAMRKSQNKGCISHRPFWNNVSITCLIKVAAM